jgi:hypothetical protein
MSLYQDTDNDTPLIVAGYGRVPVRSVKGAYITPAEACLAHLAQGTVCKILDQDEVKPHKVRYYLGQRDPDFAGKIGRGAVRLSPGENPQGGRRRKKEAKRGGGDRLLRREASLLLEKL